jgi:hypothetical protein
MALKQHSFLCSGRKADNRTMFVAKHQILNKKRRLPLGNGSATDMHATETVFST